jgi:predicted nuclease of restriction endonuclease-like (RecB) superfamily
VIKEKIKEMLFETVLFDQIKVIILNSRLVVYQQVNTLKVLTNFLIGKIIIEHEQAGENRAQYGKETLKMLSESLTNEFGRGFSVDNLELMRSFYIKYQTKFILETSNSETISRISETDAISETMSRISKQQPNLLKLSWSHFVLLMKMNEQERSFYELETIANNWSIRELERQYNSSLFERLALSKDKEKVKQLSSNGQLVDNPSDLIKQPYILEFLGLKEEAAYSESDLEHAIIDKIENFLLELGKGFLFESRQKRISFEGDDFYIDLVFYNRLLRCYVLIDLKIGKLTHQDMGQIQMYVNYFDRIIKNPEENCTIGIVLCKQSNKTVVEFTLPDKEKQIFAREYKLYLPAKEELKKQLESINQE